MKKYIGILTITLLAALLAHAGTSGVSNPVSKAHQPGTGDSSLQAKVVEFNNDVVTEMDRVAAVIGTAAANEVTIDGKYAAVGPDATTGIMVQAKTVTAVAAVDTNTFTVTFGAAPVVTVTYTEDPGDVQPLYLGTITASNFIINVTSSKNYSYVAVGARP